MLSDKVPAQSGLALSGDRSQIESLIESLQDGVLMLGPEKEIVLVNQAFSRLTGQIRHSGLDFSAISGIFPTIDLDKIFSDALQSGFSTHINEMEFFDRFFELFFGPVKNRQNQTIGAALIIHDISYTKELDALKTEFVTVASHKLRTPLTAIKLYSDMLLSGEAGGLEDRQKDYLKNIYQATERTIRLVNELLNLSKIESGRLKIEVQAVNVPLLIKHVLDEFEPLARIQGVKIIFLNQAAKMPVQSLDQNLFRQVLHILLTNAIVYSEPGRGAIEISLVAEEAAGKFIVAVKDQGIGIAEADRERIFTKFFRSEKALKINTEGTGLGLFVAKKIIDSSGGRLWFQANPEGGTIFFLALPAK